MGKLKNKKQVNLTIDTETLEIAKCYINNLSNFFETCLKNFINKNSAVIEIDNALTARMKMKELENSDIPNITYIMENMGCKLDGFEIIDNRVYSKKRKSLNLPNERLSFLKGNKAKIGEKLYFYENNTPPELKNQYVYNESDKWW